MHFCKIIMQIAQKETQTLSIDENLISIAYLYLQSHRNKSKSFKNL